MMIPHVLVLVGCLLTLVSAIGMARFRDVYSRMHAVTKASTTGVICVLVGASLALDNANDITSLLLAAILQLLTAPVGSNILSIATYVAERTRATNLVLDELAGTPALEPEESG